MLRKMCFAIVLGLSALSHGAMAQEILKGAFFGDEMAYARVPGDEDFLQNANSDDLVIGLRDLFVYVSSALKDEIVARATELGALGYQPHRLLFQTDPTGVHTSVLLVTFEYENADGALTSDSFEAGLNWNPDGAHMVPISPLKRGVR